MSFQKLLFLFAGSFLILSVSTAGPASGASALTEIIKEIDTANQTLLGADDEEEISKTLKEKQALIKKLFLGLSPGGARNLAAPEQTDRLSFLKARINSNGNRGNHLAVKRDQAEMDSRRVRSRLYAFISFLIESKNTYNTNTNIVSHAEAELAWLGKQSVPEAPETVSGEISGTLRENIAGLRLAISTYSDILDYTIENPAQIATLSWFYYIRLGTLIDGINSADAVSGINRFLHPLALDTGRCVVSLALFLLFAMTSPLVSRTGQRVIAMLTKSRLATASLDDFIEDIKRPVKYLVVYFAIDIASSTFLYKTSWESILREINYTVYTMLLVYFFFCLADALAILKLERIEKEQRALRKEFINLAIRFFKFFIMVTGIAIVLNHFGIQMTAILSTLGIGGLAFALAAKDTLSNLFGGITILLDDVFRQGDWIRVEEVEGTVVEVGLRSTTVRTFDNALVTVPNSTIATQKVRNWDRRETGRRIKMVIGVTYESDIQDLRNAVEEIRSMLKKHPDIASPSPGNGRRARRSSKLVSEQDLAGIKHTQLVYLDRFGDYSMDILVYAFSKPTAWASWLEIKEDIMYRIHGIILKNNLEFAYPTAARIHRQEAGDGDGFLEEAEDFHSNLKTVGVSGG